MADVTINDLSPLTPSSGLILPVTNGTTTGKVTIGNINSLAPVQTVFGRAGNVTLQSSDVTGALGYTPISSTSSSVAKAWVNFDGSTGTTVGAEFQCTIRSQYNVSKVVRNATGDYTVYFTSAFANANYCALVTSGVQSVLASNAPSAPGHCIGTVATTNIRVHTYNSNTGAATASLTNRPAINVTIFS